MSSPCSRFLLEIVEVDDCLVHDYWHSVLSCWESVLISFPCLALDFQGFRKCLFLGM